MFQTDQATAVSVMPTPAAAGTPGFFTNGNPASGVPATILDADFVNMLQQELVNVVLAGGLTLSKTTYTQVLSAIRRLGQNTLVLADTGAVNAYAADNATPLVSGTWVDGVLQAVKIAHTNTGASTYAPDGLTAIPIYGLGLQPLQGGELLLNGTAILMHATIPGVNSGNPICVLMECAGGAQQVPPATASLHAMQLGQATGRLLRTTVYSRVAGVQNLSVNGAANTTTGAAAFTAHPSANKWRVRIWGGASGAPGCPSTGSNVSASCGGTGGSYGEGIYTSGFSSPLAVTVGLKGNGGGAGLTSSTAGGTSSVGAVITAPGGPAISPTAASEAPLLVGGAIPSSAPTGANVISAPGQGGGVGLVINGVGVGGQGGSSGAGNAGPTGSSGSGGLSASSPGSGGAGSAQPNASSGALAGGNGMDGLIIIEEFA